MILHALAVSNWRNLRSLDLRELNHPLLVLYGPNRTGKSSLVAALRSCLYDFDHDTTHRLIRASVPWQTKEAPEVTVEFETGGARYRLMKRFSTGRDGDALLERRADSGAWTTISRGKEASREVRALLGGDKSEEGLNQLLWLTQGITHLPAASGLNHPLRRRLEEVLGVLLTGRDWDFSRLVDTGMKRWFTERLAPKRNSPIADLERQLAGCEARCAELRRCAAEAEALVNEHEALRVQIDEGKRLVASSQKEVALLEQEQKEAHRRLLEYERVRAESEAAGKEHDQAARALEAWRARERQLAGLDRKVREAEPAAAAADEAVARSSERLDEKQRAADALRDEMERQERGRGELADRRKLVEVRRETERLLETLAEYDRSERQLGELKRGLVEADAPERQEIEALRRNRDRAARFAAQLNAAALRLEIEPAVPATLGLTLDGDPSAVDVAAGRTEIRQFRQQAELRWPGAGTVRIARGQDDQSLDEAARRLESLEREYADALRAYGLAPDDDDPIFALMERQARRDGLASRIDSERRRLEAISAEGRDALAARLERLERQRQAVLERRPELAGWLPEESDLEARERALERAVADLRARERAAETDVRGIRAEKDRAEKERSRLRLLLGETRAAQQVAEKELQHLGDEPGLREACAAAARRAEQAQGRLQAAQLTERERSVDERLRNARTALERRQVRLQESENRAHSVLGELRSREGLHEDLAAAEAELAQLSARLDEERTDALAHKLLRDLFDSSRERQVQRATGLIAEQVLEWSRRLGLEEYRQLEFADGYLPSGLRRPDVEQPVPLDEESFGTFEQLALLVRLAVGRLLADGERQLAILDDPLTHADGPKHRRMLEILQEVAGDAGGAGRSAPLQVLILTCHPERFDHLQSARQVNLVEALRERGNAEVG